MVRVSRPEPMTWPWRWNQTSQVGVAEQVLAVGVGQQRTQVQGGEALLEVEVHHHGGVLPVRAPRHVGVPPGLDEAHERVDGVGERRHLHR